MDMKKKAMKMGKASAKKDMMMEYGKKKAAKKAAMKKMGKKK